MVRPRRGAQRRRDALPRGGRGVDGLQRGGVSRSSSRAPAHGGQAAVALPASRQRVRRAVAVGISSSVQSQSVR